MLTLFAMTLAHGQSQKLVTLSSECAFETDGTPNARGPSFHITPDHKFCYISDYEIGGRLFRRAVRNLGTRRIRFDWPATGLGGWAKPDAAEPLLLTSSLPMRPRVDMSRLYYDYHYIDVGGFVQPSFVERWHWRLHSLLAGHIYNDKTSPHLQVVLTSEYDRRKFRYKYTLGNSSDTPAQIMFQAFLDIWRAAAPQQLDQQLAVHGAIPTEPLLLKERSSIALSFDHGEPRETEGGFTFPPPFPEIVHVRLEVSSPERKGASAPDFYGMVPIHVP